MKYLFFTALLISFFINQNSSFAQDHHHQSHDTNKATESIIKIMQDMNNDLNKLTDAIIFEDYKMIVLHADNIVNHPNISQDDLHKLFKRLGDKKEAFIVCDTAVHNLAKDVSKAGKQENIDLVINKYSQMLKKTAECHKNYK